VDQSTVTAKGQTTIPKAIRDHLGLKPGGKVRYFVTHDGRVLLAPVLPAAALRGIVKYDGPPVSIEEMDAGIAEAVTERNERSRQR
jgi:AbrB family looped-hinge helix DNA binding protein